MFEKLREALSGLIDKVSTIELRPENLHEILEEFKLTLLENDVALVVAEHICDEIERKLVGLKVGRLEDKRKIVREKLKETLLEVLEPPERRCGHEDQAARRSLCELHL